MRVSPLEPWERIRIAVLIKEAKGFSPEEMNQIEAEVYQFFAKTDSIKLLKNAQTHKKLAQKRIELTSLGSDTAYLNAGRKLNQDYLLVFNFEKLETMVQAIFRLFKICREEAVSEPAVGVASEMFRKEEIPRSMQQFRQNLAPRGCRSYTWRYIVATTVGAGVVTIAYELSKSSPRNPGVLPPPIAPDHKP